MSRQQLRASFLILMAFGLGVPASRAVAQGSEASSDTSQWGFSLLDVNGREHRARDTRLAKATVFFFIAAECPISNRYAPEIGRVSAEFTPSGFAFFAVHSDPDLQIGNARKHAFDYGYTFPVLLDPKQALAKKLGVTMTPTVVVVSAQGGVLYRGRIDDRYIDFGRYRDAGIKPDLRIALQSVREGQPVAEPLTRTIGCALPGLQNSSTYPHH